jgi:TRAP-type C4-dicarboxylate transport system substrate-binding protein
LTDGTQLERQHHVTLRAAQLHGKSPVARVVEAGLKALKQGKEALNTEGPDDVGDFDLVDSVNRALDRVKERATSGLRKGLGGLAWMDAGARNFYDTKKAIKTLADLKGQKIRVMGNPIFVDMANSMGANGVPLGYDQVFSAMQTGVVDGAENNPPSFVFDNHFQVAKFYTVDEHLIVPEMVVLSKKIFDSMSKEDQALLIKYGKEAQQEERKLWAVYEKQAMDKAKAAGIQIIQISAEDKKAFQAAVKPVWDKYGPKYAAMIKRIQETK